jgi:hypothetical protein
MHDQALKHNAAEQLFQMRGNGVRQLEQAKLTIGEEFFSPAQIAVVYAIQVGARVGQL